MFGARSSWFRLVDQWVPGQSGEDKRASGGKGPVGPLIPLLPAAQEGRCPAASSPGFKGPPAHRRVDLREMCVKLMAIPEIPVMICINGG